MSLISVIRPGTFRWLTTAGATVSGAALAGCVLAPHRQDEKIAQVVSRNCQNPDTLTVVTRGPLADYYVTIEDSETRRKFHWNNPTRGSDGIWTTQETYNICRNERIIFYFSVSSCDNHFRDYSIQLFVGSQKARSIEGRMMMEPDHGCCGPQPQYDAGVTIIPPVTKKQ